MIIYVLKILQVCVMVSLSDAYRVLEAIIPLYITVILAYVSVKWFKLFTSEQSSGINKFVSKFSIPLLSFQVVSMNNPYKMNLKIVFADILQKVVTVFVLAVIVKIKSRGKLSWIITGLSISTLPNTLIIGIPVLKAMYGVEAQVFLTQIVMIQSLIWYNLLLLLFEFNAAKETQLPKSSQATAVAGEIEEQEETILSRDIKWSKIRLILSKAGKKLIINPNTSATLAGLIWACVHFRWGVKLPNVINKSITILSDGGLGMAMFSLGLFIASQESIIACGVQKAVLAVVLKFLAGPPIMALCSLVVGLERPLFRIAILQAALPQGIVPFVFAKEYNVHPDILSTGVILGLLIAIPFTLAYFYLLAL